MSDQVLRHPLTFWQWLTGQPGNIYTPPFAPIPRPPDPPRTPLDYIEAELERIHNEMENMRDDEHADGNDAYHKLVDCLDKLHDELIRRSKES